MIGAGEIRRYRSLRKAGRELCGGILKAISGGVLVPAARELGLWKQGILVGDEGDLDVLMDRMIYDKRWDGKTSLEHFEEVSGEFALTEDERR